MKKILEFFKNLKKSKNQLKLVHEVKEVIDLEFDNFSKYYYISSHTINNKILC